MLFLTRGLGEGFTIGDDIHIRVEGYVAARGRGNMTIKIGIEAPKDLRILRDELLQRDQTSRSTKD